MLFIIKKFLKTLLVLSDFSPFALLWMLKAFAVDWLSRKRAFAKLPAAASAIGLKHVESDVIKEFGELKGAVKGHAVCVKPDASMESRITVALKNKHKGLDIALRKPYHRPEKNAVDFKTSDWRFNRTFNTKRAPGSLAARISGDHEFIGLLNAFYLKWIFKLDGFSIGGNEIYCTLKYGFNFFPYIPASKLDPLVGGLAEIAEKVDSL